MKDPCADGNAVAVRSAAAFASLVRQVFSLDPKIRWLALEESARE